MILPLNMQPQVKAYAHHAFVNAIIDSPELLRIKIIDYNSFDWKIDVQNEALCLDKDICVVKDIRNEVRIRNIYWRRDCLKEDSLIVRVDFIKNIQRGANLNLFIACGTKRDKLLEDKKTYRLCIDQFGILTFLGEKMLMNQSINISQIHWYKVVRKNNTLVTYYSYNGDNWCEFDKIENAIDDQKTIIGICGQHLSSTDYETWMAMNYIQLYFNKDDHVGKVYLDYRMNPIRNYCYEYRYADQFLNISYECFNEVLDIFPNIASYIKKCLEHRYYVAVCIDEYYVPQRINYQKEHFYHHNLFYGYDEEEDNFLILGYAVKLVNSKIAAKEVLDIRVNSSSNIIKYKRDYNSNIGKFNLDNLIFHLENFRSGKSFGYFMENSLADDKGAYGLQIFDELKSTDQGKQLLFNDARISFVFYEHSLLMEQRIKYLANNIFRGEEDIEYFKEESSRIVEVAERLKNLVIKNLAIENRIKEANEINILKVLDELCERENIYIGRLINKLREEQKEMKSEENTAIITCIDKNFEENLEYDFLKSLFSTAHYSGKVIILDYGMNEDTCKHIQEQFPVIVYKFDKIMSIFSLRYKHIPEIINSLEENITEIMVIDGGDVWFQCSINQTFELVKDGIGVVAEERIIGEDEWTNKSLANIEDNLKEKILCRLEGKRVINAGVVCGNRRRMVELYRKIYNDIVNCGIEFFGIDQLYLNYEWYGLSDSEKVFLDEKYNYVMVSHHVNEYEIKENIIFNKNGDLITIVHNAGGNWRLIKRPFINKSADEEQYYVENVSKINI